MPHALWELKYLRRQCGLPSVPVAIGLNDHRIVTEDVAQFASAQRDGNRPAADGADSDGFAALRIMLD